MQGINSQYLTEAAFLERKWAQTKVLTGLEDRGARMSTAVLLENQQLFDAKIYKEADSTGADDVAIFRRITIPLVRRIYPQLIANKIVSVQPMIGPTGLVFYLRFRYGTTKGETTGSDTANAMYPNTGWDTSSMQQKADGTPVLDIWYSAQRVNGETDAVTLAGGTFDGTATMSFSPVLPATIEANSIDAQNILGITAGTKYTVFGKINRTVTATGITNVEAYFYSAAAPGTIGAPTTATVTAAAGAITTWVVTFWNDTAGNTVVKIDAAADPGIATCTFQTVAFYEYKMECTTQQPKVTMALEQEEIVAKPRRLAASWSWEAAQDLRSQHNVDAEEELTAVLAQEINLEIDREILLALRAGAGTVAQWDFQTALGDTLKEKYESLYVKIVEVSNIVMKKTLRGPANWIVTSPEIASMFETATAGFAPASTEGFETALGIQYVGTVQNRWKLYKDPLFPTDQILLGYKGDGLLDSGFYYCPYVPLQLTPTVLDPNSFCPRKGILTRYGMKMLREGQKYYALIKVLNFHV